MKRYSLLILFVCCILSIQAQYSYGTSNSNNPKLPKPTIKNKPKNSFDLSRLTFGGGIGLQFGDYTAVNIAPQIGYDFSKYINAGAGLSYTYYREKFDHDNIKRSSHYFGFNVYTRIYPVEYLVVMVQPEINRMWRTDEYRREGIKNKEEKFIPVCLVGGGLRLGPMTAMIQYDIAQNENSPYGDRIFYSVGYTFNF